MGKLLAMLGAVGGGWVGWALGAPLGIFTAYVVSTVGMAAGVYGARRIARQIGA